MKLVTWNVNSIKARLPRLLELLAAHRPDIACLQETKVGDDAFPHAELADAGYEVAAHCGGRWAGVAVLSRSPSGPEDVACGLPGLRRASAAGGPASADAAEEARWVEATVEGVRVASVYVPNGRAVGSEPYRQKLAFLAAMRDRVEEHVAGGRGSLVVAGDMNVCPTDLDVYDPAAFIGSTHVTDEERSALRAVLAAGGLVDAFRHLHPDEVGYTWWDYRAGHFHKRMGLRIDQVLLTRDLAERLETCGIDRGFRKGPKPSDHAPLLATFAPA